MKLTLYISKFNEFLITRGIYFWFVGMLIPLLYFSMFINIRKIINFYSKRNIFSTVFLLLMLVQLMSIILSFFNEYFTFSRFVAILHNLLAFTFLFFGYYFAKTYQKEVFMANVFKNLFYIVAIFSISAVLYSFITQSNISYPGFLYYVTGIDNDKTFVHFTHTGFLLNFSIPRSRVFGTFPNTTAFILVTLFSLYTITAKKPSYIAGIILVLGCLTTGARFATLISLLLVVFQFITNKKKLITISIIAPVALWFVFDFVNKISELREDSNVTRFDLYYDSIKLTNEVNPVFGIGLKPLVDNIAVGELPVGSHSTFIGYYVKNGMVGFSIVFLFVLIVIILVVSNIIYIYFNGIDYFERWKIFGVISMPLLLSVLFFDDLDAYELMPFLFGMQIYFFEKSLLLKFKY